MLEINEITTGIKPELLQYLDLTGFKKRPLGDHLYRKISHVTGVTIIGYTDFSAKYEMANFGIAFRYEDIKIENFFKDAVTVLIPRKPKFATLNDPGPQMGLPAKLRLTQAYHKGVIEYKETTCANSFHFLLCLDAYLKDVQKFITSLSAHGSYSGLHFLPRQLQQIPALPKPIPIKPKTLKLAR